MYFPITNKINHTVKFGLINPDNFDNRGTNILKLMNPPIELEDNYYWLRDNSRTNEQVLEHIKKENEYTDNILKPHNELKNNLYEELKSRIREDYDTYKYKINNDKPYKYFSRFYKGKDYPVYFRTNLETNLEEELLNVNILAENKKQCDVSSFEISPDHKYISYGVDYDGSEKYNFIIQNIDNNEYLEHNIPKLSYCSYIWTNHNIIYYLVDDGKNRLYQLWLFDMLIHTNTLIYEEHNDNYDLNSYISSDKKYIIITSGNYNSNYSMYIDLTKNYYNYHLFQELVENVKYNIDSLNNSWLIHTNIDNSTNWKIMVTEKDNTNSCKWIDFIPYNKSVHISGLSIFKNFIVFKTKINGNTYINITNKDKSYVKIITHLDNKTLTYDEYINTDFASIKSENVYTISLGYNIYEIDVLNILFTSMTSLTKLYDYNLNDLSYNIVHEKIVPNYNEDLYESKRIWIPQIGTELGIPVSIVYRKELYKQDGKSPLYLYGYGSYGHTVNPSFNSEIIPILDRGFVYAIAHIRGGSFLGYEWYLQGKMYNKMNTFNDFIRVAEFLGENKYCNPKKIVSEGRSAGGLLIGATTVLRPDLWWITIPGVPFVDVLNTMSDSSIPLTTEEWTQWGNPNEKEGYEYIKQYCPYYNIKTNNYPHMYCTAGLHDPRVPYWEILKVISKIREYKTDMNLQVIRVETEQGHFGGSSRYKSLEETAEKYAFILTR